MSAHVVRPSVWRWYPRALAAAMLTVVAVNGGLVYWALHTFPGATSNDGFDASNDYNRVLAAVARQKALGWSLTAEEVQGRAVVHLRDAKELSLRGVAVTATAERPLGMPTRTELRFVEETDGVYVATTSLPQPGQWDLQVRVDAGDRALRVTRRILMR